MIGRCCGDVGRDDGAGAAILDAEREDVHAFAAHADAAVAKNAARAIEEDDGGPLLLFAVVLGLGVEAVGRAVLEGHVLQLALAAGVADGAVERMVAEQELEGGFAGLGDLGRFGGDDHAFGDGVVQAVCSLGTFSRRTTHMRQAAWRERPG